MAGNGTKVVKFDVDARTEVALLLRQTQTQWSDDDLMRVKDLQKYILDKEDVWILDEALMRYVGDVLGSRSGDTKVFLLRVLAAGAMKDNFDHFLNLDRRHRCIMKYANRWSEWTLDERKAIGLLFCNLFTSQGGRNWLLYFSDWTIEDEDNITVETTSNARITCKVARLCMESRNPTLLSFGSGIAFNMACRDIRVLQRPTSLEEESNLDTGSVSMMSGIEVNGLKKMATLRAYDAIALEITICIVDLLRKNGRFKAVTTSDDVLYRCLKTLVNFVPVIQSDLLYYDSAFKEGLENLLLDDNVSKSNRKLVEHLVQS